MYTGTATENPHFGLGRVARSDAWAATVAEARSGDSHSQVSKTRVWGTWVF